VTVAVFNHMSAGRHTHGLTHVHSYQPQRKNTDTTSHSLTFPMDVDAVIKQNFAYRMLLRDIYWFY